MQVKNEFFSTGFFELVDGWYVQFWDPLAQQYLSLYNIVYRKHVLVARVLILGGR
jgi:hypothetical protein